VGLLAGSIRLFITPPGADIIHSDPLYPSDVRFRVENGSSTSSLLIFPPVKSLTVSDSGVVISATANGVFGEYFVPQPAPVAQVNVSAISITSVLPPPVKIGAAGVAENPDALYPGWDKAFYNASVYKISLSPLGAVPLPPPANLNLQLRLSIDWIGDVARVYDAKSQNTLVLDQFYNGRVLEVPLNDWEEPELGLFSSGVVLRILPLRSDAPIYFANGWPKFHSTKESVTFIDKLNGVKVIQMYDCRLTAT
jgi:hypothetical protein